MEIICGVMENQYMCTDAELQGLRVRQPKVLSKQHGTVYSPVIHHYTHMLNMTAAICKRQTDRDRVPPSNEL